LKAASSSPFLFLLGHLPFALGLQLYCKEQTIEEINKRFHKSSNPQIKKQSIEPTKEPGGEKKNLQLFISFPFFFFSYFSIL
jgi:hypothetical protein